MTFFSADKPKPRRIEIDASRIGSNSPEVQKRLDRIRENYDQLNSILAELESQFDSDERLKAIDDANVDFEITFGGSLSSRKSLLCAGGRKGSSR
jgi:hypothetical protein